MQWTTRSNRNELHFHHESNRQSIEPCSKIATLFQHRKRRLIFYFALTTVLVTNKLSSQRMEGASPVYLTRNAKSKRKTEKEDNSAIPSWAQDNARPLRATSTVGEEVSLFWHIPKSGGTTVKKIYECLGQTLATAAGKGRRFIPDPNKIIIFNPHGTGNYVNVDTSTREGLLKAASMNLVPSGKVDLIFATDVKFAVETLFDKRHPGRLFALFRHPIHRLVSKFYYMQRARWERSYDPQLKDMTLLQWATSINTDNNFYIQHLSGKIHHDIKERDLRLAMRILRKRFIVGLTEEMEESVKRFNIVMGVDYGSEEGVGCMNGYFGEGVEKKENSIDHPVISEGSPEWDILYTKNKLDVKLYEYVVELFAAQDEVINEFTLQHLMHLEKKVSRLFNQINRERPSPTPE